MTLILGCFVVALAGHATPAEGETRALFGEAVPELLEANGVQGAAVALVRGGEVAWADGFGMANVSASRPVTADTIFNIGSISKVVTAWGVMRLVEQGDLDPDEPVETYLTRWSFPTSEHESAGVTGRRLMSHTAGLSMPSIPGFEVPAALPKLEEILSGDYDGSVYAASGSPVEQVLRPGSTWRYSGGGTVLLQLLIEEITDESFTDHMTSHVLAPLGMASSRFGWTDSMQERAAIPYAPNGRPFSTFRFTGTSGAGLYSTANDLARFLAAGLAGSNPGRGVLTAETLEEMNEPVLLNDGSPSPCGLGYFVQEPGTQPFKSVSHNGSNFGWQALMHGVPEHGSGLVVLTNSDNGSSLFQELVCLWMKTELEFTPANCE